MIEVPTRNWSSTAPKARNTEAPITEKQEAFLNRLLEERPAYRDVENLWPDNVAKITKRMASQKIDEILKTVPKEAAPRAAGSGSPVTEDGMYRTKDGTIYKVQVAVHGSGNLYAKRMVALDEPRVMKTKTVSHEFEYAPGAIKKLTAEDKMTLEEAKAWGALYGTCCCCGATLTNETSIAAGIGPVCGSRF